MKALYFLSVLTLLSTGCERQEENAGGGTRLKDYQQREETAYPEDEEVTPGGMVEEVSPEGQEEPSEMQDPEGHDSSMGSGTDADPYASPTENTGVLE
jgi:hypothetical protein